MLTGIIAGPVHSQTFTKNSNVSERYLLHLLEQKDFFRLRKDLDLFREHVTKAQQLYCQSYLDNAFNKNKEAIQHAEMLLNSFSSELSDSAKAALYLLKGDAYFKLFQYANAARNYSLVLSTYAKVLDSNQVADIRNKHIIYDGLKNVQPQQTLITGNTTVQWVRNKIGIVELPIKRQNMSYQAVFDTRANISAITQSYATKLRLQVLPVYYYEGSGITGNRFKTSLAVADSLFVGDILIRHAVFQVVPDSVLYIAPVDFQMNVIIGFPIIAQLREIHFYKDGRFEVPAAVVKSRLHNLALDGLNPVISMRTSAGDSLVFAFDFGASRTILFAAYFQRYRQSVLASGIKTTTEYGGAGGSQKKEVLTLPSIDLFLADKKVTLDSVDVFSEKVYPRETFYGNIGQDFIGSFQELLLNFRDMYIKGY